VHMLEDAVRQHAETFKGKFKGGGMDRAFHDKELIERLEEEHKINWYPQRYLSPLDKIH